MAVTSKTTGERLFPSWSELLQRAAERLKLENKVADAAYVSSAIGVTPPDYLGAARHARQALGPLWYRFLKEQFDVPFDAATEASLRVAKDMWLLGSDLVVTTNYDNVLRWACPDSRQLAIWDIEAPAEMAQLLQGTAKPTIWHLHGQISNAANIILTPDGYSLLYPDEHNSQTKYKAALATLRNQFVARHFLFAGWSFADASFGFQLDDVVKIFAGASGPHYALVPKAQLHTLAARQLPVELVPFDDFGKPLEEILAHMASFVGTDPTPAEASDTQFSNDAKPTNPQNYTFLIPYREKGQQVIGREDALKAVRKQLVEGRRTNIGHTAAFQGVGGLGKTQLAVEYCYRFKTEYPLGVIWLNADQDIDSQLINIAEKAGWVPPNSINALKLLTAKQRIRSNSQCLLVFDNLTSVDRIKDYLPEAHASPHILITSRLNHPGFEDVPLEILTPEQSLNLLIQESGKTPRSAADLTAAQTVATTLEGLPLALELAGAYLRHRDVTWEQYLALFKKNLKEALPGRFLESFTQHEKDIYSTLKINEEVFAEEPRLKDIIDVLTWSASAPMGESLLSSVLDVPTHELTGALGLGVKLRILQKSPLGERYSLHRLLQHVRRAEFSLSGHKTWVEIICERMARWFQSIKRNYADLPRFEAEIDHLREWYVNASTEAPEKSVHLLWLQAYPLHHRGKNTEVLGLIERALKLYDNLGLQDVSFKAQLLNDLGATQNLLKNYEAGDAASHEALKIRLEVLGEGHVDTAMSLYNHGMGFANKNNVQAATPLLEKAYAIWRKAYSADDVYALMAQCSLAQMYFRLGRRDALELAEKTLSQTKHNFGEKHPLTAAAYHQLGLTYPVGDKRSTECLSKALTLRRELLGEENFFAIDSLRATVGTFCSKGLHNKAESLLKEYVAKLPKNHPDYQDLLKRQKTIFDGVFRPGFRTKPKKR